MKPPAILAIVFLILSSISYADEPEFSGTLRFKDDRCIFTIKNTSRVDWIIVDLRYTIETATLGLGDLLIRGREWTLLLKSGSGFPSEQITIGIDGRIDPMEYEDGNLYLSLRVAKFDRAESRVGEWQFARVAFRVIDDESKESNVSD